jgi:RimJ/RimL family protein N-acetyltransferase
MVQSLVKLEPFADADIDRLISWIPSRESLAQWTGTAFDYPLDRAQLVRHLTEARQETPVNFVFKALDPDTGRAIGHGELARIDAKNLSAALARILVGPSELRGRGIGEGIVRALLEIAFDHLSLHRVALNVFDFNQAAIRCYQKVGFKQEGVQREACKFGDEYWNVCIMGILEYEYREWAKGRS